jgi:hypothetical protein
MRGDIPPLPIRLHGVVLSLKKKHRDFNFTVKLVLPHPIHRFSLLERFFVFICMRMRVCVLASSGCRKELEIEINLYKPLILSKTIFTSAFLSCFAFLALCIVQGENFAACVSVCKYV